VIVEVIVTSLHAGGEFGKVVENNDVLPVLEASVVTYIYMYMSDWRKCPCIIYRRRMI
jgi:hypothetical protein